jgi:hypothetical protein
MLSKLDICVRFSLKEHIYIYCEIGEMLYSQAYDVISASVEFASSSVSKPRAGATGSGLGAIGFLP